MIEADGYCTECGTLEECPHRRVSQPRPGQTGSDQEKGHRDSSDTDQREADDRLLAGLRDGAWLDAQNFPPLRFAIPGLIPEGLTLGIGPPKAGKSWLFAGLLLSVASGGYALGKLSIPEKRPTLYLALEDGDRRMQDRCRQLLGDGEPIPPLFHYMTVVPAGQVLAVISAFLRRTSGTALVVLDTLGKVMPPAMAGESAYQRDYRIGTALKRIADEHPGLSLVVIHHDRKAAAEDFVDSVSGTHGLAGAADTIMVLHRKRQSTDGLLKVTGRDVPEAEYAIQLVNGTAWTLDGADLAAAAAAAARREDAQGLSDTSAQIIDFVRQEPRGVTAKQVVERFGDNARQYLKRHYDAGRLDKLGRGLYVVPMSQPSQVSFPQVIDGGESDSEGEQS